MFGSCLEPIKANKIILNYVPEHIPCDLVCISPCKRDGWVIEFINNLQFPFNKKYMNGHQYLL